MRPLAGPFRVESSQSGTERDIFQHVATDCASLQAPQPVQRHESFVLEPTATAGRGHSSSGRQDTFNRADTAELQLPGSKEEELDLPDIGKTARSAAEECVQMTLAGTPGSREATRPPETSAS